MNTMIYPSMLLCRLARLGFFKPTLLFCTLLAAAACGNGGPSDADEEPPAEFAVIDKNQDLLPETEYGTFNGTQLPVAVSFQGGRYFDYGEIEVQAFPDEAMYREQISYRLKKSNEWQILPAEEFTFFVGYDGKRHLLVDQGSNADNRTLQLWDIQSGRKVYSGTYNHALLKQGRLYLMRYAGQNEVINPPTCDPSQFPGGEYAFELVIAVNLRDYQEQQTGQVICAYAE